MKKIIFFIGAIMYLFSALAQTSRPVVNPNDIIITPGVGVGALKLGMNENEAFYILKGDITWKGYKEEMQVFKSYGDHFAIDSIVQFVLGFDSCAAYASDLSNVMPVYSLYFREHKLNFITVTSYGKPANTAKRVVLKNGIRFNQPMATCMAKMKTKFMAVRYDGYDGDHIYYKEGLEFTYDGKKLTTIGVFTPVANFPQRIADKSYDLKQEFEDID
jgi:hypothetical protein